MYGFWRQTLCHFRPSIHLGNVKNNKFCDGVLVIIMFIVAAVVIAVMYLPMATYKAFAPHRIISRIKAIKESQQQ